jgi:hypothetical protein
MKEGEMRRDVRERDGGFGERDVVRGSQRELMRREG